MEIISYFRHLLLRPLRPPNLSFQEIGKTRKPFPKVKADRLLLLQVHAVFLAHAALASHLLLLSSHLLVALQICMIARMKMNSVQTLCMLLQVKP